MIGQHSYVVSKYSINSASGGCQFGGAFLKKPSFMPLGQKTFDQQMFGLQNDW